MEYTRTNERCDFRARRTMCNWRCGRLNNLVGFFFARSGFSRHSSHYLLSLLWYNIFRFCDCCFLFRLPNEIGWHLALRSSTPRLTPIPSLISVITCNGYCSIYSLHISLQQMIKLQIVRKFVIKYIPTGGAFSTNLRLKSSTLSFCVKSHNTKCRAIFVHIFFSRQFSGRI